jgi:hypothetical protein
MHLGKEVLEYPREKNEWRCQLGESCCYRVSYGRTRLARSVRQGDERKSDGGGESDVTGERARQEMQCRWGWTARKQREPRRWARQRIVTYRTWWVFHFRSCQRSRHWLHRNDKGSRAPGSGYKKRANDKGTWGQRLRLHCYWLPNEQV